jgi:superoxide dismutase, Cu-Zn family
MNRQTLLLIAMTASLASLPQAGFGKPPATLAKATLALGEGSPAGSASIRQRHGKTLLELDLTGLTPGAHGMHFHAVGQCGGTGPAFSGAGPHLNPAGLKHGTMNPAGHHMGDLPNVTADAHGKVKTRITLDGDPAQLSAALFDADGSALVIHAGPDDNMTDPSGNSGARVACGVLTKG